MKAIASGAEATIYEVEGGILKDRVKKPYRHEILDEQIRTGRTRREANILKKLPIPGPKLLRTEKTQLLMSKIGGVQVKTVLDKKPLLAKKIGEYLGKIHDANIIHADLTTSNMHLDGEELFFLDFGLSYSSRRIEDKAVDLHLFKQALESKHWRVYDEALKYFIEGYTPADRKEVLERLETVELRGRNKAKW